MTRLHDKRGTAQARAAACLQNVASRPDGKATQASGRAAVLRARQGGFTLIELLVTLSVTVIGLAGLLSLHATTIKGNQMASRAGEAATIAQGTMEELRVLPVQADPGIRSIESLYGPLPIVDEPLGTEFGRADLTYTRWLSVRELTSVSEDLVLLRVEVVWADDGADPMTAPEELVHRVSLELIRTRQEAL